MGEYASKGVAGTGLGLGIAGTALSLLGNGGLMVWVDCLATMLLTMQLSITSLNYKQS